MPSYPYRQGSLILICTRASLPQNRNSHSMYRLPCILITLLLTTALFTVEVASQDKDSSASMPTLRWDSTQVGRFTFSGLGRSQAFLKTDYGKARILNPATAEALKDRTIEKVQLVYTDFPKGKDLGYLHQQRLKRLHKLWPSLFERTLTQWELVRQTDCQSEGEAAKMFHGFVINYREPSSRSGSMSGAKKMELLLEGRMQPGDSTVLTILSRNKDWEDILVVADLTGSMSPYIGQLLLWLKLNSKTRPAKYFVFFNDGDEKSDFEKEIGKTGGIYYSDNADIWRLLELAKETMRNGYGGDEPENNMEAILFGIEQYPNFKEVVMIADNWATPRDMELIRRISVPVRVVLCGTEKGINPNYLDIARYTNGSVHTIEQDLDHLMELGEGETISIGERQYRIHKGRFKLVR